MKKLNGKEQVFENFANESLFCFSYAAEEAAKFGEHVYTNYFLLLGILHIKDTLAFLALSRLGVDLARARSELQIILGKTPLQAAPKTEPDDMAFTDACKSAIETAVAQSQRLGDNQIEVHHLLFGILRVEDHRTEPSTVSRMLLNLGVDLKYLKAELMKLQATR